MVCKKTFPCMLAACLLLSLFAVSAAAQTGNNDVRQTTVATSDDGAARLETDPIIISRADTPERLIRSASTRVPAVNQLLIAAIDTRLGSPYVYGSEGPYSFDCSGFVWSVFQSAGIRFERGSARTLWSRFTPATREEEQQFGTLVFFSGLSHIGIVADANGFYHSSRSQGVIYSPFSKYWLSRVDGYRRVPLPAMQVAE
jgi:cell wall-associated NlpC family hydrolase